MRDKNRFDNGVHPKFWVTSPRPLLNVDMILLMMWSLFLCFVTSKMYSNLHNNLSLCYCKVVYLGSTFPTQFESSNLASKCQSYGQNNITGRDKRIQFKLYVISSLYGLLVVLIYNKW